MHWSIEIHTAIAGRICELCYQGAPFGECKYHATPVYECLAYSKAVVAVSMDCESCAVMIEHKHNARNV